MVTKYRVMQDCWFSPTGQNHVYLEQGKVVEIDPEECKEIGGIPPYFQEIDETVLVVEPPPVKTPTAMSEMRPKSDPDSISDKRKIGGRGTLKIKPK